MPKVIQRHKRVRDGLVDRKDISSWGRHKLMQFGNPRHEVVRLRKALGRLRLRYKEVCAFYNPHHLDKNGRMLMQWFEFVVWIPNKGMGVLILDLHWPNRGHANRSQRTAQAHKEQFLNELGLPYLIVNRRWATDEMEVMLARWVRRAEGRKVRRRQLRLPSQEP